MVYKWRPGQPDNGIGDFLGDMTDELDRDVITEFVSGGEKNYGYQTRGGKVVSPFTGFHLERPRLRHPQFPQHERQYCLGIRHASGLSSYLEH